MKSWRQESRDFSWNRLWARFDGDQASMNIAHECIDRHRHRGGIL